MNYEALIKRVEKAIKLKQMQDAPSCVHKVDNDTDITNLAGLVIVLHPNYVKTNNESKNPC